MNEKSWMKIRNKEKKQKSEKKSEMKLKKLTPLAAIILMTLILLVIVRKSEEPLSVETILKYTPENMILAACVLVLFFALKSLTIMFPLSILYLSSGVLFTPFIVFFASTFWRKLQNIFGECCISKLENIAKPGRQLLCQPHSHCRQYLIVTA